jgi:hypothetical protein
VGVRLRRNGEAVGGRGKLMKRRRREKERKREKEGFRDS